MNGDKLSHVWFFFLQERYTLNQTQTRLFRCSSEDTASLTILYTLLSHQAVAKQVTNIGLVTNLKEEVFHILHIHFLRKEVMNEKVDTVHSSSIQLEHQCLSFHPFINHHT